MQLLEDPRMRPFECIERQSCEGAVRPVHTHQRGPRGVFVIEQRVVEIEQDDAGGVSGSHIFIIETCGVSAA